MYLIENDEKFLINEVIIQYVYSVLFFIFGYYIVYYKLVFGDKIGFLFIGCFVLDLNKMVFQFYYCWLGG